VAVFGVEYRTIRKSVTYGTTVSSSEIFHDIHFNNFEIGLEQRSGPRDRVVDVQIFLEALIAA